MAGAVATRAGAAATSSLDPARAKRLLRRRRWLIAAGSALVLYTLFGFVGVPLILRKIVVPRIGQSLNGTISLGKAAFNPFTLALKLGEFDISDPQQQSMVAFQEFRTNFQPVASIFKGGWRFKELALVQPFVRAELYKDGVVNFEKLMKPAPAKPEDKPAEPMKKIPRIVIQHLSVDGADVGFRDMTPGQPFDMRWQGLTFAIDQLDTRPDFENVHKLSTRTASGEELTWEGNVHVDPLSSKGRLTVKGLGLPQFMPYSNRYSPAVVTSGDLSLSLDYEFAPVRKPRIAALTLHEARVHNLRVEQGGQTLLDAPELRVENVRIDAERRSVVVALAAANGTRVRVERDATGRLVLQDLLAQRIKLPADEQLKNLQLDMPASGPAHSQPVSALDRFHTAPSLPRIDPAALESPFQQLALAVRQLVEDCEAPWSVVVEKVQVVDAGAGYLDSSGRKPVQADASNITVDAGPIRSAENYLAPFTFSASIDQGGKIQVDGTLAALDGKAQANIKTESLQLSPAAAYLPQRLIESGPQVELAQAQLSVDGHGEASWMPEGGLDCRWKGTTRLESLRFDSAGGSPAAAFEKLQVAGDASFRKNPATALSLDWKGQIELAKLLIDTALGGSATSASADGLRVDGTLTFSGSDRAKVAWDGVFEGTTLVFAGQMDGQPVHANTAAVRISGASRINEAGPQKIGWDGKAQFAGAKLDGTMGPGPASVAFEQLEIEGKAQVDAAAAARVAWDGAVKLAQVAIRGPIAGADGGEGAVQVGELSLTGATLVDASSGRRLQWKGKLDIGSSAFDAAVAGPVKAAVGSLSVDGDFEYSGAGAKPELLFKGNAAIGDVTVDAPERQKSTLKLTRLSGTSLEFTESAKRIIAQELSIDGPSVTAVVTMMPPSSPKGAAATAVVQAGEELVKGSAEARAKTGAGVLDAGKGLAAAGDKRLGDGKERLDQTLGAGSKDGARALGDAGAIVAAEAGTRAAAARSGDPENAAWIRLPYEVSLAQLKLTGGAIVLRDDALTPPAEVIVDNLEVSAGPVASDGRTACEINVESRVNNTGGLRIKGTADPFRSELLADLELTLTTVPLKPYDPFSGRFLGYAVDRGRSTIRVPLKVENGKVIGKFVFDFDGFHLGSKVPSPDSPDLPIPLGLDILRDRQDHIKGNVPFEGYLNDPKFSFGGLIWEAFLGFLLKAVTAPFDLIAASLNLAGDQDISKVVFAAGSAELSPEAVANLDLLNKALQERPAIKLTLVGHYADADLDSLRAAAYRARLQQESGKPLTDEAFRQQVEAEYAKRFGRSSGAEGFAPPPEMQETAPTTTSAPAAVGVARGFESRQAAVARNEPVESAMLAELANRRAVATLKVLTQDLGLISDRISVQDSPPEKLKSESPVVTFEIR